MSNDALKKLIKLGRVLVGVHDGPIHADDVAFAVIVAGALSGLGCEVSFIRTRDPDLLDACDIVGDVGHRYKPESYRFDHHQRSFSLRRGNKAPYAAAGLAWLHFGKEYLRALLVPTNTEIAPMSALEIDRVWGVVDREVVSGIDAMDVKALDRPLPCLRENPRTMIPTGSLSQVIAAFNPVPGRDPCTSEEYLRRFELALGTMRMVINNSANRAAECERWRSIVSAADLGDPILVVDTPASDTSPAFGPTVGERPHIKLVVYPAPKPDSWRIATVPVKRPDDPRKLVFPGAWAGQEPDELNRLMCIDDAVFCHPGRWLIGTRTKRSALKVASHVLELSR